MELNWDEIESIDFIGEEETIDINVSGNRLFYADGILTHNSAVEETEFNHGHIAGGISKINTCDNIFAIFTSRALRERGGYQLQCLKSRSSTGEGHKIDLSYNMETMRITDGEKLDQIDNDSEFSSLSSIATSFKKQTETVEVPKQNSAKSDMLKSLLSEIKSKNKTE